MRVTAKKVAQEQNIPQLPGWEGFIDEHGNLEYTKDQFAPDVSLSADFLEDGDVYLTVIEDNGPGSSPNRNNDEDILYEERLSWATEQDIIATLEYFEQRAREYV